MARDLRGLPRPRDRLRGRARADLRPGRRLVPEFAVAARRSWLPIPLTLVGILPGARALRRVLHGDLDDRLHRGRRHHRAQLDHPRGLHRARARRGDAARGGGASRPARCASGRCCSPRPRSSWASLGDPLRPDLPGARGRHDGGRSRGDAPVAGGRPRPLLPAQAIRGEKTSAEIATTPSPETERSFA